MYLLISTYTRYDFDEHYLHNDSHVIGTYETLEYCKEAAQKELREFFSDSGDNECDDEESLGKVKKYAEERTGSMVLYDLDDSNFTRPYAERYILEYNREEYYGLDVIKYLVIKI